MSNNIQESVLRGILDGRKERLHYAFEKLSPDYFQDECADLWRIVEKVYDVTKEVVDSSTLEKVLGRADLPVERIARVEALWTRLASQNPLTEVDFKSCVALMIEDFQRHQLGLALTESFTILTKGVEDEKTKIKKTGVADALDSLRQNLAEVEDIGQEEMPEFDIRSQRDDILAEFQDSNSAARLPTGCAPLDEMTNGGIGLGELWLCVAAPAVGKSMLGVNWAQHVVAQGYTALYFTTETLFKQIRHRALIRHAHEERFGLPNGISSLKVRKHSIDNPHLDEDELEQWIEVVDDFTGNENYGKLIVCQVPKGARLSLIESKMYKWQQETELDLVIIDSIDMISADTKRSEPRDELNSLLDATKHLAVSFNGGKGARIVSPWQPSRSGHKAARETGRYEMAALAETSLAERRADLIFAMLEQPDSPGKLKGQTLKFRDSTPRDFDLRVDYDRCYIGSNDSLDDDDGFGLLAGMA